MADPPLRPTLTHQPAGSSTGGSNALSTGGGSLDFGPPATAAELGRLAGYRVLRQLGMGGMGAVYLGFDEGLRRQVALKVMLPKYAADPLAKERFLREARAAAQVHSDHVVTIYQVGEDREIPFIAMEFLTGYPLDEFLRRNRRLLISQVLRIGLETASGLTAAHALGLVHRDIKPANLWLEAPHGRVKILDFGLAKSTEDGSRIGELTGTGVVIGTPAFMSPQQARGEQVDHRTDLFSLGGVLFHLATARLPFEGPAVLSILEAVMTAEPPPVQSLNPEVPPALAELIHRLLAKDPAARPQSAEEAVNTLRAIEQGQIGSGVTTPVLVSGAILPQVVYVPLEVSANHPGLPDNSAFADLDAPPAGATSTAERPRRESRGGFPGWLVAAALLFAGGIAAGAFYLLKKPAEVVHDKGGEPKPTQQPSLHPAPPAKVVDTPNRQLALWVLSKGGSVNITPPVSDKSHIRDAKDLPDEAFLVTDVFLPSPGYAVTDDDLDHFAGFPKLVSLALGAPAITNKGLERLSRMPFAGEFRALSFSSPNITEEGFHHLAQFRKLRVLRLSKLRVDDSCMRDVGSLTELTELSLTATPLTVAGMGQIPRLKKLEKLDITGTSMSDDGIGYLIGHPALTTVYLNSTKVTDAAATHLAKIPKLASLSLSNTGITDVAMERLAVVKTLTDLNVTKTKVTLAGVKRLLTAKPKLKVEMDYVPKADPDRNLAEWVISNKGNVELVGATRVTDVAKLPAGPVRVTGIWFPEGSYAIVDADIERLRASAELRTIALAATGLTDDGLAALAALPQAEKFEGLGLRGAKATAIGVARLARCKALQSLDICRVPCGDHGVAAIAGLPKLSVLYLRTCEVTDAGLEALRGIPFTQLYLGGNPGVGDAGVRHILNPNLTTLELSGTRVTDAPLEPMGNLAKLSWLSLNQTKITDVGLDHLRGLKTLATLNVSLTKVTTRGVKRLLLWVPGLKPASVTFDYDPRTDPDRILAAWVFSKGGKVSLDVKHQEGFSKGEELPAGSLRVTAVWLGMTTYRVTDEDLELFRDCGVVWHAFGATSISDKGVEKLATFPVAPRIEMLGLQGATVTDSGLAILSKFQALKVLELRQTSVGDEGLKKLAGTKTLNQVFLFKTKVTAPGVKALQTALPRCEVRSDFEQP